MDRAIFLGGPYNGVVRVLDDPPFYADFPAERPPGLCPPFETEPQKPRHRYRRDEGRNVVGDLFYRYIGRLDSAPE